jgi:HEAT repeat protein
MHARYASMPGRPTAGLLRRLARLALLFLPVSLLVIAGLRLPAGSQVLWLGALFQGLAALLVLLTGQGWRIPAGPAQIMLYVIALSWLLLATGGDNDWFLHLAEAILLVVPLGFFGAQCLRDSGAPALRRARQLARRLAERKDWPDDLGDCRFLPEVKALREALHVDADPALTLLNHKNPAVRVAGLSALEFRQSWRPGQPQMVLSLAQRATEPEVRAAAVSTLANTDERGLVEALAEFLTDPSRRVRQAAAEAVLWHTETNWDWVRHPVRMGLAHPNGQDDGPLELGGRPLHDEAVADLKAWAAEKGVLAHRAALTLGAHYTQALAAGSGPELLDGLRDELADPRAPTLLRLELARLLHEHREIDNDLLRKLLTPSSPAPVRLLAVEALLALGDSSEAVAALHDLARLPNREIALATAEVIQRRLGVDLGLPRAQALPPIHSRLAAEVARRVLIWASAQDFPMGEPAGHRHGNGEI